MSKILFISQRYYPAIGGAENFVRILAEWCVRQGHEVDVWTSDALEADALWFPKREKVKILEETIQGVHVKRFKTSPLFLDNVFINKGFRYVFWHTPYWRLQYWASPPTTFGMYKQLLRNDLPKYDIIHVSAMPYVSMMYVGMQLAKKLGSKFYITPFQHLNITGKYVAEDSYYNPRTLPFFHAADKIFIQTESERNALMKFFHRYKGVTDPNDAIFAGFWDNFKAQSKVSKETPLVLVALAKIFTYLIAVPFLIVYTIRKPLLFWKKKEEIDDSKLTKMGLGIFPEEFESGNGKAFRKEYNIDPKTPVVFYVGAKVFVKGVKALVLSMEKLWNEGSDAKLVLAGGTTIEFEDFWQTVSPIVKRNTLVLDRVTDKVKADIYEAGDVFVMVSKSESFGLVYLEAWIHKLPVIGCNIGSVSEVIDEGEDGYLVEFDDVETISKKIDILLKDKKLRNAMGEKGYKKVMKDYTWPKIFKRYAKYFNE